MFDFVNFIAEVVILSAQSNKSKMFLGSPFSLEEIQRTKRVKLLWRERKELSYYEENEKSSVIMKRTKKVKLSWRERKELSYHEETEKS